MAETSKIEWTDATWNPITGCSVVSPGCTNCYAMKLAGNRMRSHPSRAGLVQPSKAGMVWSGEVRFNEQWLDQPLRWKRPRRIFVCAHGDLFHENVPDDWIDRVFAVMAAAHWHAFQVLTKRADRMREYLRDDAAHAAQRWVEASWQMIDNGNDRQHPLARIGWSWAGEGMPWPLPNVWLGVSAEDQPRADERIPALLDTPAAVRFVSAEPLLGPLDVYGGDPDPRLGGVQAGPGLSLEQFWNADGSGPYPGLDWVICGGESGPGARPMHPDWARSLRDQCAAAGVAFFFKQWGEWLPDRMLEHVAPRGCLMKPDGTKATFERDGEAILNGTFDFTGWQHFACVGKKAAGRLLDGVTHDGMPGEDR